MAAGSRGRARDVAGRARRGHLAGVADRAAATYLLSAENGDGGFGPAPGQASDQLYSGWAALGLAAAGHALDPLRRRPRPASTTSRAGAAPSDLGALERTILVVRAAGLSPRCFGGHDLVAALRAPLPRRRLDRGQINLTAFAVLALRSAGARRRRTDVRVAGRASRTRDGGFSFTGGGGSSDVDDTGAALEALAGEPGARGREPRAVAYLRRQQDRDGGFPSQAGMSSNAQSTAWAIQGLDAAGVSPATLHRARRALAAGLPATR